MRRVGLLVVFLAGAFVALALLPQHTAASAPHTIQYQGRLTDSNGKPLEGVVGKLTFKIYSSTAPSAGTFLWGEAHLNVPVRRGVFTVLLGQGSQTVDFNDNVTAGSANPLTSDLFNGSDRFIQVKVNGDVPLAPLTKLGSVPFAISAGGSVPIGTVVDWYRPTPTTAPPAGWAICDGSLVTDPNSPLNGKKTPNLLNRFVRGIDPNVHPSFGGFTPGGDPVLPDAGGTDSNFLSHAHGFSVPAHQHTISADGQHQHSGSVNEGQQTRFFNPIGGVDINTYEVGFANARFHAHSYTTPLATSHSHTGAVASAGGTSSGTSGSLGGIDNRPLYFGLLKIMRVR